MTQMEAAEDDAEATGLHAPPRESRTALFPAWSKGKLWVYIPATNYANNFQKMGYKPYNYGITMVI